MDRPKGKVAGILLAAGASTRMGRTKQLMSIEGETLIERVLGQILASDLDSVIVVLGYQAKEIQGAIAPRLSQTRVRLVENCNYRAGISTSIAAGIGAVEETHDYAMIFLADMPCVPSNMINQLCRRCLASGLPIGATRETDRPAHPVMFSRTLFPELKGLKGDVGARSLLKKYRGSVCLVEPEGTYSSLDIDTPEAYADFERMNVQHRMKGK